MTSNQALVIAWPNSDRKKKNYKQLDVGRTSTYEDNYKINFMLSDCATDYH